MANSWQPYCGQAPRPDEWLARWNFDPVLLIALGILAVWAARRADVRPSFWIAYASLVLLFVSPLCALSSALFSVRVVHHVLLTAVAAPLMVWGVTGITARGSLAGWALVHALLFWLWHAPAPYALALSSDVVYWIMQGTLLLSALGFWAAIRATTATSAIGLLLVMMVQMGLLGALITFAGAPLYAPHFATTIPWGLTPSEDQQLAGLVMWIPAAALYLFAALVTGWRMFPQAREGT